jgi:periplasmic protein TonB
MSELARRQAAVAEGVLGAPSSGRRSRGRRSGDVVAAVFGDDGGGIDWFYGSLAVALVLHVFFLGMAIRAHYLHELPEILKETRAFLHEYFWQQYDVVPENKPPPPKVETPPPPEAPPLPAPAPVAKLPAKAKDDPYEPPPPPAQAAKALTQKEDPDKIEDLTGNTVVTGEGSASFGQQSAQGKGDKPVLNPAASLTGTPGGTGTVKGPPPPPPEPVGPDRSQAAKPEGSSNWNCPFPPEADADQIDQARVSIVVTVRADGTPASVSVLNDPGHGFGRAARMCALGRRYSAALDRSGSAITASTPPINVTFTR